MHPGDIPEEQIYKDSRSGSKFLSVSMALSAVILVGTWMYILGFSSRNPDGNSVALSKQSAASSAEETILPPDGVVLPIQWGDLGMQMVRSGVIDRDKLERLYAERGGLPQEADALLAEGNFGRVMITQENSGLLLNLLWAFGLSNKNDILTEGEMSSPRYGGAGGFASTGGWTLAFGDAMEHYGRHPFVVLTPDQQQMVERVSKNIYRPCCDNSTHFPDCNHGMAMLGLLELIASQDIPEEEMYRTALQVNAYWFPDQYRTIAQYLRSQGAGWNTADPREILGTDYSSGSGYRRILSQTIAPQRRDATSCDA